MIDIFIRTCAKDHEWLSYAVMSIAKYVSGYRELVIAYPRTENPPPLLLGRPSMVRFVPVDDLPNGYIGQQHTKLMAPSFTDADHILYWDSDCVASRPFNAQHEYTASSGRCLLLCSKWSAIGMGAEAWLPITEAATGIKPPYEFMRTIPLLHHAEAVRDTVSVIEQHHGVPLWDYLGSINGFSEFNAMGAVAFARHKPRYRFVIAEENALDHPVQQFWSHGGIGQMERDIIHSLLGLS